MHNFSSLSIDFSNELNILFNMVSASVISFIDAKLFLYQIHDDICDYLIQLQHIQFFSRIFERSFTVRYKKTA